MLVFIGTPNLTSRNLRLISKLALTKIPLAERENVRQVVHQFLESRWDTMRFLTYAENEVLMNKITDSVNMDIKVDENVLVDIVTKILRTSTIQGQIQDEYIASEILSRI